MSKKTQAGGARGRRAKLGPGIFILKGSSLGRMHGGQREDGFANRRSGPVFVSAQPWRSACVGDLNTPSLRV